MNKGKKILVLFMTMALLFALCTPVFASYIPAQEPGDESDPFSIGGSDVQEEEPAEEAAGESEDIVASSVPVAADVIQEEQQDESGIAPAGEEESQVLGLDMETLTGQDVLDTRTDISYTVEGDDAVLGAGALGYGKALKLNGTNYIDLADRFQPTNAYTMMGWLRQDAGASDGQVMFARGNSGNTSDQLALMAKNNAVYHCFSVSEGSGNKKFYEVSTGAVLQPESWNHVAVTREGANLLVYVNGEVVLEKNDVPDADFAATTRNMYIGMDCNSSGALYPGHAFKGLLDELELYNFALKAEDIQAKSFITPSFTISKLENGSMTLELKEELQQAPVREDFTVEVKMNEAFVEVEFTGYEYIEASKTAVFTFTPLTNKQNVEKPVSFAVRYGDTKETKGFTLPGSDNKSPLAKNPQITNSSPKLGAEPHTKGILRVKYDYEDPDGDLEGKSKYQWYIADSADGTFKEIQGIRTKTIILMDTYVGKFLRCEVKPADENGNIGKPVMSSATTQPVVKTLNNPLTDWFHEANYGLAHHFLSNYFNLDHVAASEEERWDRTAMSWDEFIAQFDADAYAKQVNDTGAKYVIMTLGQNSGSYCAPNAVYDKYMREVGLLKEGEANPKTVSMETDLPMRMADALEKYDIKVMLYLPSNPPHSASWDETGTPNGYGYFSDYLVTTKVFGYTPGTDGTPTTRGQMVLSEMVEWWSEHYGDKIGGWWFDGCYPWSGIYSTQIDMSREYNLSTLANAAKAGNPYSIITFNPGIRSSQVRHTVYDDYSAGECPNLDNFAPEGRWAENTTDCQNFAFGPLGNKSNWCNGWGCKGLSKKTDFVVSAAKTAIEKNFVIGFDVKTNIFGEIDPEQYAQMVQVNNAVRNSGEAPDIQSIQLNQQELKANCVGDRLFLTADILPVGASMKDLEISIFDEDILTIKKEQTVVDITAKKAGKTKIVFQSKKNPSIKAECTVEVLGRTPTETIDDADKSIRYSTGFAAYTGRGADPDGVFEHGRSIHYTSKTGTTATLEFDGTGVDVVTTVNTDQGISQITIDGKTPVEVNTQTPNNLYPKRANNVCVYSVKGLPDGKHTIEVKNLTGNMTIDAFRIYKEEAETAVDKQELQNLVNSADRLLSAGYTKASWETFSAKLTQAKTLLTNEQAEQNDVDKMASELDAAIKALVAWVPVTGVTLNPTNLTLQQAESALLTASIQPQNASNPRLVWSTGDASVASVDQQGRVTGVKDGTTNITATAEDGAFAAACKVIVTKPEIVKPEPPKPVEVSKITLNMATKYLEKGKTTQLSATVFPHNADDKTVSWVSSNKKVATVDGQGKVKAIKNGTANITATAGAKKAVAKIQVGNKYVSVSKVKLDKSKLTLNEKGSYTLKATLSPAKASNNRIVWASSNPKVATVSQKGKIQAKSTGVATITATSQEGGKVASCTVAVKQAVKKVTINKSKATLKVKASLQLKVTISPKAAGGGEVVWKSSNPKIATVSASGKVKALRAGSSTITATIGNKKVSCRIQVR